MNPTNRDNKVLIRPYRLEDADGLHEAMQESLKQKDIYQWMRWSHSEVSLESCQNLVQSKIDKWQKNESYDFAIYSRDGKTYLGDCILNSVDNPHKMANLGYWIRASQLGKGYAASACKLLIEFGFLELRLERIELVIGTDNIGSQRTAEKIGATKEAILKKRVFHPGLKQSQDAYMYSIIRGEK